METDPAQIRGVGSHGGTDRWKWWCPSNPPWEAPIRGWQREWVPHSLEQWEPGCRRNGVRAGGAGIWLFDAAGIQLSIGTAMTQALPWHTLARVAQSPSSPKEDHCCHPYPNTTGGSDPRILMEPRWRLHRIGLFPWGTGAARNVLAAPGGPFVQERQWSSTRKQEFLRRSNAFSNWTPMSKQGRFPARGRSHAGEKIQFPPLFLDYYFLQGAGGGSGAGKGP